MMSKIAGRRLRLCGVILPAIFAITAVAADTSPAKKDLTKLDLRLVNTPWTGDLDGMIERRMIRALVVYSKTFYFVDKGTQRGTSYDALRAFEDELNKSLKTRNLRVSIVFVPVRRDQLFPALRDGLGDIAAANLAVTAERQKLADFSTPLLSGVSEVVVTGPGAPDIRSTDDLSGKEIFVRKSSSYFESLTRLNQSLHKSGKPDVKLKLAPEQLEDEDLLEMVNAGLVPIIIVDNHKASFWAQIFKSIKVHEDVAVNWGGDVAWAFRKGSPKLKEAVDDFVKRHRVGTQFGNVTLQKYLKNTKWVTNATSAEEMAKFQLMVELFKKYAAQYGFDWLMLAAQGYQESRLDQSTKSPSGAIGVMQVMPATGASLKVGDITQVDANIHAGTKYMRTMLDTYFSDAQLDDLNRNLFAFAAYNAGPSRIAGLRKEAAKRGLNPNVWFDNVERIAAEKIGRETVTYVSNIYKYYVAYTLALEQSADRERARETVKKKADARCNFRMRRDGCCLLR
ncbi:MAG TPA: transporter substrate-binding domain-containing protein [Acidobacteriota bacterium]|nr:transporter substrate-binding domain-containing protein [Acidobacteriota bacterium]